jgi:hypothetical protein
MVANYSIVQQVTLDERNQPTGETRHVISGTEMSAPATLRIVRFRTYPGYYLLYLDETGRELTDTYHESLAGAVDQARWEYRVQPGQWEICEE